VKGGCTGADRARRGLFEEAEGGTLFLDEVSETSTGMQAKLLRVLQDGEVRPIGTSTSRKVDVRVIAASNRDLREAVRQGGVRRHLFHPLPTLPPPPPPLPH